MKKPLLFILLALFAINAEVSAQPCPTNLLTNSTFSSGLTGWSQYGTVNSSVVLSGTNGCLNNYYILQPTNNSNTGIKQPVTFKKDSCYNLCYCFEIPNSGGASCQLIFAAITPGVTVAQLVAGTFTPAQAQIISQVNTTTPIAVNYNCLTTITASGNFTDFVVVNQTVGSFGSDIYVDNICLKRDTCQFNCNNTNPVPFFSYTAVGNVVTFTNTSTVTPPFMSLGYSWNFGDPGSGANDTSTAVNPTHTYPGPGTYTACLNATAIDPNTIPICIDSICLDIVIPAVGIDENISSSVGIYPNPATNMITIKGEAKPERIMLVNMYGQTVLNERLQGSTVQLPELPVGIYWAVIETSKGRAIKKLVINH